MRRGERGDLEGLTGGWATLAVVRFLSELGMLAALALVAYRFGSGIGGALFGLTFVVLAVFAPAGVWGYFIGPRAPRRLHDPARLALEVVLFGSACAGLVAVGYPVAAVVLAIAYLASAPVGRRGH